MSRYGWFACTDCKIALSIGKAIFDDAGKIDRFHIGGSDEPSNARRPDLTRALWKILAEHAGHPLRVVTDADPEYYNDLGTYVEIGGDETGDIDFETFLSGWEG